jgi:UDP-4-amino-4,6-dideoxy-N-acetyl-beta-L-altrosamine N-acetyltransferase
LTSLREIRQDDRDQILQWRNLASVRAYMHTDHIISPEEHAAWFARVQRDPTCKYWIIVCDGEDVGVANLSGIESIHRRCYWGFYLASPNVRGKGVGSAVEYAILNYVFDELHLEKLCGEVLSFNEKVLAMHGGFGFAREGVLRKHIFKGGQWHDVVTIGILKEEWGARRPEQEFKLRAKGII